MKLLPDSFRRKLDKSHRIASSQSKEWIPFCEESLGRKLSAPSPWLCGVTDVGLRRSNNEDEYFLSPDCKLWVVADGMGGHAAGEIASALTVQSIVASIDRDKLERPSKPVVPPGDRLMGAFDAAQQAVSSRSLTDEDCRGMGSTAIAGLMDGEQVHICHVGDVRAYHMSDGTFRRVTNDHSLVWELVMSGLLTPDEARHHPQRAKVTQALGQLRGIKPDLVRVSLKPLDRVLLCSDGLWEAIADHDIHDVLRSVGSIFELASQLVDAANAAGGEDNITAILYEHPSTLL